MEEDRQADCQIARREERPGVSLVCVLDDHCEHDRCSPRTEPADERHRRSLRASPRGDRDRQHRTTVS
jgi:hypothetical protein